ncbi:hypothetical protein WBG83_01470 [Paenibacillus sp. y28]
MNYHWKNKPELQPLLDRLHMQHGSQPPRGDYAVFHWSEEVEAAGSRTRPAGGLRFHSPSMVVRAGNETVRNGLLHMQGMPTSLARGRPGELLVIADEYVVPVFHLEALALFKKKSGLHLGKTPLNGPHAGGRLHLDWELLELAAPPGTTAGLQRRQRGVMQEAVKAVYGLGLDAGLVRLGMSGSRAAVLAVDPLPQLHGQLAELYAEALHRFAAGAGQAGRGDQLLLGADPEFMLRTPEGKVKSAALFFARKGLVGCDAVMLRDRTALFPLVELRPKPSGEPKQLIRHLRQAMQLAAARINMPDLEWLAGGMPMKGVTLGGHIHFSGIWLNSHLLRVLDNYLALPLMLLEADTARGRRPRYGFLGDFRRQPHGGFEYRTLPSWLVTPGLTKGVLALARLLALAHARLHQRPLEEPALRRAYYRGDKQLLYEAGRSVWEELRLLPEYRDAAPDAEPLQDMLDRGVSWNEQQDIRKLWRISPFNPVQGL